MTEEQAREALKKAPVALEILDILLTFGPIMPHSAKVKAAQQITEHLQFKSPLRVKCPCGTTLFGNRITCVGHENVGL